MPDVVAEEAAVSDYRRLPYVDHSLQFAAVDVDDDGVTGVDVDACHFSFRSFSFVDDAHRREDDWRRRCGDAS